MAWEISISSESWQEIHDKLETFSKEELAKALANYVWEKENKETEEEWQEIYNKYVEMSHDILVQINFEHVVEINTCDNGGNGFYLDPKGCSKVYLD